ncbi:MAG: PIN domain-containing protein [Chloroflexota bacterium]|nr:MAG: PIN domain-containing protein [Chloroflexota bacterium]
MAFPKTNKASSVFVDSTVLIAAAISDHGRARDLILDGLRGQCQLHLSTLVLQETERNLAKKQPRALPAFEVFQATLLAAIIDPAPALVLEVAEVVNPKDAPIVAAAIAAQATYLATYDRKHLLGKKDEINTSFGLLVAIPDDVLAARR